MSGEKDRVLQVVRGTPPKLSTVLLPKPAPASEEVLVQIQATALTPTDVLLCHRPAISVARSTAKGPEAACFVPGVFFCGKVIGLGAFVNGLHVGEAVLGIAPLSPEAVGGLASHGAAAAGTAKEDQTGALGGCYRDAVSVHFSSLLPVAELVDAKLQLPSVVAHVPPMISALLCVASHLRLRPKDALLIVAPRLSDVAFVLQRLLLISDAWRGPLYLIMLHGHAPCRADLERHPLLRPLLLPPAGSGSLGSTFLDDVHGFSVEEHIKGSFSQSPLQQQAQAAALWELVAEASSRTAGLGLDAILALDVDLGPEEKLQDASEQSDLDAACVALEPVKRQPTLLRTFLGALALRGRFVTNCERLEMCPEDGAQLWAKECSMSFLNPHCLPLSAARHGELLHAAAEVCGRLAAGELAMADSEVTYFRLFEQFSQALEAMSAGSSGRGQQRAGGGFSGTGSLLVTLLLGAAT